MKLEIGQTVLINLPADEKSEMSPEYWGTNGKFGEVVRYLGQEETAAWVRIFSDNKARGYDMKDLIPVNFDNNGSPMPDTYSDAVVRWLNERNS